MSEQEESTIQSTCGSEDQDDCAADDSNQSQENVSDQISTNEIEKLEEEKLKAKFPMAGRPMSGHSAFLQKRLANRQKYFDSGDYQMAKQKTSSTKSRPLPAGLSGNFATGDTIPTPESVPIRKTSIIQTTSKFTPNPAS